MVLPALVLFLHFFTVYKGTLEEVTNKGSTDVYTFSIVQIIKDGKYLTNPEFLKAAYRLQYQIKPIAV